MTISLGSPETLSLFGQSTLEQCSLPHNKYYSNLDI